MARLHDHEGSRYAPVEPGKVGYLRKFKGTIAVKQRLGSSRGRRGFTLIEVLIVITIVTILATLLLRTIGMARSRANVAREQNDVSQLGMSLEAFKQRFGIYPPSRIRLRENTSYGTVDQFDQHSVQYLKRIWPNLQITTTATPQALTAENQCILWCLDNPAKKNASTGATQLLTNGTPFYELEGDECLVFFLGGIAEFNRADPNSRIILHGFSKNSRNPGNTPNANDPSTLSRDGPFHEFDAGRLYVRTGTQVDVPASDAPPAAPTPPTSDFGLGATARPAKLPSYRAVQSSTANPIPVVYFSSYEGRGYRPHDLNLPDSYVSDDPATVFLSFQSTWPTITTDLTGHPVSQGPNPYTMTRAAPISSTGTLPTGDTDPFDAAGAIVKPFASDSYQIISPGADGKLGRGGKLPPPGGMTTSDPQYDNIASFTGGSTVGAFSEAQRRTP